MTIPATNVSAPTDGRQYEITVTPPDGDAITLNCSGDIATAPGQNDPSVEVQIFQGGDYTAVTQDGGYKPSTYVCEKTKTLYDTIDQLRADNQICTITLGGDDFTGEGLLNVSEGPTIPANGKRIETMTVQITWTNTKKPSNAE